MQEHRQVKLVLKRDVYEKLMSIAKSMSKSIQDLCYDYLNLVVTLGPKAFEVVNYVHELSKLIEDIEKSKRSICRIVETTLREITICGPEVVVDKFKDINYLRSIFNTFDKFVEFLEKLKLLGLIERYEIKLKSR